MSILKNIKEHDFNSSVIRLEIWQTVSRGKQLRKLGKIVRTENQVIVTPNTDLGLHMSIHDANSNHLMARIHHRINSKNGIFKVYPNGINLGRTIEQIDIPSFPRIKGVLHLPPETSEVKFGSILANIGEIWKQSPIQKKLPGSPVILTNIDLDTDLGDIGTDYFFIEPNNLHCLVEWYDDRAYFYERIGLVAEVFKVFVPWFALVIARSRIG